MATLRPSAAGGARESPFSALATAQAQSPTSQSEDSDDIDTFLSCEVAESVEMTTAGSNAQQADPRTFFDSPTWPRRSGQELQGTPEGERPCSLPDTTASLPSTGLRGPPRVRHPTGPSTPPHSSPARGPSQPPSRAAGHPPSTVATPDGKRGAKGGDQGPAAASGPNRGDGGDSGGGGGDDVQGPATPDKEQCGSGGCEPTSPVGDQKQQAPPPQPPQPQEGRGPVSERRSGSGRSSQPHGASSGGTKQRRPLPPPSPSPPPPVAASRATDQTRTGGVPASPTPSQSLPPSYPHPPSPLPSRPPSPVDAHLYAAGDNSCLASPAPSPSSSTSNVNTSSSFLAARVLSLDATQRSAVLRTARLCRAASASRGPLAAAAAAAAGGGDAAGPLYGNSSEASRASSLAGACDAAAAAMELAAAGTAAAEEKKSEKPSEAPLATAAAAQGQDQLPDARGPSPPGVRQPDFAAGDLVQSPFGSRAVATTLPPPLPTRRPSPSNEADTATGHVSSATSPASEDTAAPASVAAASGASIRRLPAFASDGGGGAASPLLSTSALLPDLSYLRLDRRSSMERRPSANLSSYFEVLDLEISSAAVAAAAAASASSRGPSVPGTTAAYNPYSAAAALARRAPQPQRHTQRTTQQPLHSGNVAARATGGGAAAEHPQPGIAAAAAGFPGPRLPYSSSTSRLQDLTQQPPLQQRTQQQLYSNRLGWSTSESTAAAVPFRSSRTSLTVAGGGSSWWNSSGGASAAPSAVHSIQSWSTGGGAPEARYPGTAAMDPPPPPPPMHPLGHLPPHPSSQRAQHHFQPQQLAPRTQQSDSGGRWPLDAAAVTAASAASRRLPQREVSFAIRSAGSQAEGYGEPMSGLAPPPPPPSAMGLDLTFAAAAAASAAATAHGGDVTTPRATAAANAAANSPFAPGGGFPAPAAGGLPLPYGALDAADYGWLDRLVAAAAAGDQGLLERVVEGLEDGALAALLHTVELLELSGSGAAAGATGPPAGPTLQPTHAGAEPLGRPSHYHHHHHQHSHPMVQDLEPPLGAVAARAMPPASTASTASTATTANAARTGMERNLQHTVSSQQLQQPQRLPEPNPHSNPWGSSDNMPLPPPAAPPPPPPVPQPHLAHGQRLPPSQPPQRQWRHGGTAVPRTPEHAHSGADEGRTTAAQAATSAAPAGADIRGNKGSSHGDNRPRQGGARGRDDNFHAPAHIAPLMLTTARTIRPRKAPSPSSSHAAAAAPAATAAAAAAANEAAEAAEAANWQAQAAARNTADGHASVFHAASDRLTPASDEAPAQSPGASAVPTQAATGAQPGEGGADVSGSGALARPRQGDEAAADGAGAESGCRAEPARAVNGGAGLRGGCGDDGPGGGGSRTAAATASASASDAAGKAPLLRRAPIASPFAQFAAQGLPRDGADGGDCDAAAINGRPTEAAARRASADGPSGAEPTVADAAGTGKVEAEPVTATHSSKPASSSTPSRLPPLSPGPSPQLLQASGSGRQPSRTVSGGAAERRGSGSLPYWRQQGSGGSGGAAKPRQQRQPQHQAAQYYHHPSPQRADGAFFGGGGGGGGATNAPSPSPLRPDAPVWPGAAAMHATAWTPPPLHMMHMGPSPPPHHVDGSPYGGGGTPPLAAGRQYSWQVPYQVAHAVLHASPFTMPHLSVLPWPGGPGFVDGPPPPPAGGDGGGAQPPYEQSFPRPPPPQQQQQQHPHQQQGPHGPEGTQHGNGGPSVGAMHGHMAWSGVAPGAAPMARAGSLVVPISASPPPYLPQPMIVPVLLSQQPSGGLSYVVAPSPPPMETEGGSQQYQQQQQLQAWQVPHGVPYGGPWPQPAGMVRHAPEDGRGETVQGAYAMYGWPSGEFYYAPPPPASQPMPAPPPASQPMPAPPPASQPMPAPPPAGPAFYPPSENAGYTAPQPNNWHYSNPYGTSDSDAFHRAPNAASMKPAYAAYPASAGATPYDYVALPPGQHHTHSAPPPLASGYGASGSHAPVPPLSPPAAKASLPSDQGIVPPPSHVPPAPMAAPAPLSMAGNVPNAPAATPSVYSSSAGGGLGNEFTEGVAVAEQQREGRPAKRQTRNAAQGGVPAQSPQPRGDTGRAVERETERRGRSRSRTASPGGTNGRGSSVSHPTKPPRDTLSALKWCHVQHSRKQAPALDDQQVKELVRVQLQSSKPIRPPWYRDVDTSRQQAQAAAANLQQRRRNQGQQQQLSESNKTQAGVEQEAGRNVSVAVEMQQRPNKMGKGGGYKPEAVIGTGVYIPGR